MRCGKILLVTALVLAMGLHFAALQTVAWAGMLANNLCSGSFSSAVTKTFDGEHPCPICKAIAAAKAAQQKTEAVAPLIKMEFPLAAARMTVYPPATFKWMGSCNVSASSHLSEPLVPPPRTSAV